MAKRCNVYHVRITGVNPDPGYVTGVFQAQMLPGLAGVGSLVDTVSVGDVSSYASLTHAGVDHVVVRLGHRDCSYR
jgi:hypothetical protein